MHFRGIHSVGRDRARRNGQEDWCARFEQKSAGPLGPDLLRQFARPDHPCEIFRGHRHVGFASWIINQQDIKVDGRIEAIDDELLFLLLEGLGDFDVRS